MRLVDKNIDRIIKYNACQFKYIKIFYHAEYDVESVKGYKLTPNQKLVRLSESGFRELYK